MDPVVAAADVPAEEEPEQLVAKEMFDAEYSAVHAVKGPAHAMKFVVIKAQGPAQDADAIAAVRDPGDLARQAVAKAVLLVCEDVFPGYLAPVEKAMVIRAEHDDVLQRICATVFPGRDVADVAGRLVPTAYRAAVQKLAANSLAKGAVAAVPVEKSTDQFPGMTDALAALRAISGPGPDRSVVTELAATDLARLSQPTRAQSHRLRTLKSELAAVAAELRSSVSPGASGRDRSTAVQTGPRGHEFSLREEVIKAEASTAALNDRPDSDFAYVEEGGQKDAEGKTVPRSLRHFPIFDADHVRNALSRAPQSPFGDKAMPKIRAAAKKFGIDVSKAKEAGMTEPTSPTTTDPEPVKKADGDLDAGQLLAEPEGGADGSATAPSSEAWERVDAATARKWTAILSRARAAVALLFDRENQEAALGSDGDVEDAWNLEDAACAIDYAISCLAPFAVDEEAEADAAAEAMGVAKAMASFKEADLAVIESLAPVKKAGRVLSAANEQAIRDAVSSLQKVLASLPAAPAEVAKAFKATSSASHTHTVAANPSHTHALGEPAPAPAAVTKAKGDPMVPVYDANGKLCGMVDATDIVPIADAPGADKEPAPAPAEDGKEVAGAQPAAAAQPEPNGAAAAAPAEQPDQQQAVAKSQLPQTPDELAAFVSSEIEKAVKARDEDHAKVVKSLEDRVNHLEQLPAPKTPLLGPVPLGGMKQLDGQNLVLRGQSVPEGDPELERIQKALEAATDPVEISQLLQEQSTRRLAIALGKK